MKVYRFVMGAVVASQLMVAGAAHAGSYVPGANPTPFETASISSVLGYGNSATTFDQENPKQSYKLATRYYSWRTPTPYTDYPTPYSVTFKGTASGDKLVANVTGQGSAEASVTFSTGLSANNDSAPTSSLPFNASQQVPGPKEVPIGTWNIIKPFNNRPANQSVELKARTVVDTNAKVGVVAGPNNVLADTSVCTYVTTELSLQ